MNLDRKGPRLRGAAAWMLAPAVALSLGACATATVVDGATALDGRDLDTAVSYYGDFDSRLEVSGRTYYVWRREVAVGGSSVGCELRAEVAFRRQIRATQMEGFPAACEAFSVRFTAMPETRRADPAAIAEAPARPALRAASGCPGCRPVGGPAATASATARAD